MKMSMLSKHLIISNKRTECEPSQFFVFCARFESVCKL